MVDVPERWEGPYGWDGNEVGMSSVWLLEELFKEDEPRPANPFSWSEADHSAFNHLWILDTGIKFIEPEQSVDGSDIADLYRLVARLHGALPFSEPEREWLLDHTGKNGNMPESVMGATTEIMSGGIRRVLQGRDLVRRWGAWRRETDEFVGQGSLQEGCLALGAIAETLVIEPNRPREWPNLRRRLDALEGAP